MVANERDWEALKTDASAYNKDAESELFTNSHPEIQKAYKHYCKAEEIVTYVSTTLGSDWGHDIAAINQLRYAGRHLLDALHEGNEHDQYESVRKAVGHCHRACYDAAEAGTM